MKTRIPLPRKTEEMLSLSKKVLAKHLQDGDKSLLNALDWQTLQNAIDKASELHAQAEALEVQRKMCNEERDKLLSVVRTGVRSSRNVLSGCKFTSIQSLGEWGFDVIESPAKSRSKSQSSVKTTPAVEPIAKS